MLSSEQHAVELIERVKNSFYWEETAVIVTYDDFGGWYDHVPPPVVDRWGPGGRVPMLLVSPYARKGFVEHTPYDTTSILKFIEWRYGLEPLTDRDAGANNLLADFGRHHHSSAGGSLGCCERRKCRAILVAANPWEIRHWSSGEKGEGRQRRRSPGWAPGHLDRAQFALVG